MGETELSHDNSLKFSMWPAKIVEVKISLFTMIILFVLKISKCDP